MNKKILSAILTAALALTFTACGEDKEAPSSENTQSTASAQNSKSDETDGNTTDTGSTGGTSDSAGTGSSSEHVSSNDAAVSDDMSSEEEPEYEKPELIESRIYVSEANTSWNYRVDIYDNGSWIISQELGNKEVYASYSYEDEAAGNFVTVQSYNLAFDPPENKFEGNAKFKMTEETLEVQFESYDEPEIFVRHSLDEPLY